MSAAEALVELSCACEQAAAAFLRLAHSMDLHEGEGWVRGCPECDERLREAAYRV